MLRSIFFAVGIFLLLLGAQSLIVDKLVVSNRASVPKFLNGNQQGQVPAAFGQRPSAPFSQAGQFGYRNGQQPYYSQASALRNAPAQVKRQKVYQTREWMPWSLLAAGTIVIMYSASMGRN